LALEGHVHQEPARLFAGGLGVVIVGLRIELGLVRIGLAGHLGDPDDARHLGVGVVEQHPVADLHPVAHEVACLVVAHAVPGLGADPLEVVDGERVRFGLHQPVAGAGAHPGSFSCCGLPALVRSRVRDWVQMASGTTSHAAPSSASTCCTSKPAPTSHGGALRVPRNAKLRSYQPPPMPSRWPAASKPTSGITTSAISSGASAEDGSTSGSGMPKRLVTSGSPERHGAKRSRSPSSTGRHHTRPCGSCICSTCRPISPSIAQYPAT